MNEHRCTGKHVGRVKWRYTHKPEGFDTGHVDGASGLFEDGRLDELGQMLRAGIVQCDKHLRTIGARSKASAIRGAIKMRDLLFSKNQGKGRGSFIRLVLRRGTASEELTSVRREVRHWHVQWRR